jgi:GT2 family glycosyltransferase
MMSISVVIPNYNGEKLLKKNLHKVVAVLNEYAKEHKEEITLIINDDGSTDSSREILKTYEEKIVGSVHFTILYNERNYGFSTTVNRGVAKATSGVIVLLNSDVIPDTGFLEPLLKHFEDENVFAVGCMDKSVEKDGIVLRGRGIGSWKRGFLVHRKGGLEKSDTLWVSGGSGAFRKTIWDKLHGLNEMMDPFYWEDIDLSYRALKAGYTLRFEKKSTVVHEHEEGAIKKSTTAQKVNTTAYRNQFFFVWTNISDAGLLFRHVLWLPYHIISAILRKDSSFLRGFGQALMKCGKVLRRRRMVQKMTKVSDAKILRHFA